MQFEDEAAYSGPHDHPVIAALTGCLVLVGATLLMPRMLPPQPYTTLLGAGVAAGFLLWLIGFAVTIRLSASTWKLGSLAILLGAGLLAGHLANGQYQTRLRADPSTFTQIEFGPGGTPVLPSGAAARGPVSKLFAEAVAADAKDRRELSDAMGKFGTGNLNSPYLLAQNPQAIANCGAFDGLKTMVREQGTHRAERLAAIGTAIDAAELDPAMKDALHEIAGKPATVDPVLENQLAGITATADLCALLAKKSWYNDNAYFGFNSGGDAGNYKGLQALRAAVAGEAERLDKAAAERMKAGQEKMRALLS